MNLRTNSQLVRLVNSVLNNFDFRRVYQTMDLLDWEWAHTHGVPNVTDIINFAERLLWDVVNRAYDSRETCRINCGGFKATADWFELEEDGEYNNLNLTLEFVVTDWNEELHNI